MASFPEELIGYEGHFQNWMDRWIHKSQQQGLRERVAFFLHHHPDVIDKGYGWSYIADLADQYKLAKGE